MAATGLFLILTMGVLIALFTQTLFGGATFLAKAEFTGGPIMAGFIFALFAAILAFGIAALHGGLWQIRHKRRDPRMLVIAEYSFTALTIVGTLVSIISVFTGD